MNRFLAILAVLAMTWALAPSSACAQLTHGQEMLASQPAAALYSSSSTDSLPPASEASPSAPARPSSIRPFSTVGIAVSASTLGIGGQVAVPLSNKTNLRVEGNFFSYNSGTYTDDGIQFAGTLKLRSVDALLDWFPFGGGFHLSPGVQLYNGLNANANLSVASGQNFTLNDVSYDSGTTTPITGTGTLTTRKVSPMFTFGWGNIVPRHGHFSVPLELGFVYQGAPTLALTLAGQACDDNGANCRNAATDAGVQTNLAAQQKIASDDAAKYFRFYPILSLGFGYKF